MALTAGTTTKHMWKEEDNQLVQEFTFPDFATALNFVNRIGVLAEEQNHHPDIELGYGKVKVKVSTHDQGRVTDKDWALANVIDKL